MASTQDIITAVKNLDVFLKIPALKGASVRMNKSGKPYAFVGGFNMVFQLTHESKKWAFRVWHVPFGEYQNRFKSIADYLRSKNLPYFAEFIYDKDALLVNGELVDTIRMEWLEGVLLKEYLENHLSDPIKLNELADNFLEMCKDLEINQIAHGDLQEGNIIITPEGKIRLIDYDSVCIPDLQGAKELVTGYKGYQHPSRFKGGRTSLKADFFSELIIYITILALSERPELWDKYQLKDTPYLLFSENDFENFEQSDIYKDLSQLSRKIVRLLAVIKAYLAVLDYTDLKPFYLYLEPPKIITFEADSTAIIYGGEITISWNVENSLGVTLDNGIGDVPEKGNIQLKPKEAAELTLTALGFGSDVKESILLNVFPTPIIKSLVINTPEITSTTHIEIKSPEFPNINLGVDQVSNSIKLDNSIIIAIDENNFKSLDPKFDDKRIKGKGLKRLFSSVTKNRNLTEKLKNRSNEKN